MGSRIAVIHSEPHIAWHGPFAAKLAEGLRRIGIESRTTRDQFRHADGFPVLLGTTRWRAIESGMYLLVDRCSFGDTDRYVSLVWGGHGRRGDHRIPERVDASRWERHGIPLKAWRTGARVILCGQTESYSPDWPDVNDWYRSIRATHFRPHPCGHNPTRLPTVRDFENCRAAVVLNSSVAVQAVLDGVPTVTTDPGSMAWDVTGHSLNDIRTPERASWCHALAWTQWEHEEIKEGRPIAHLFERV